MPRVYILSFLPSMLLLLVDVIIVDPYQGKERQVRPDEPHGTAILGVGGAATASRGGGTQGRVAGRGGRAATPGTPRSRSRCCSCRS
ncbi:hypothetical protein PF002_g11777 [Phytophthora fragariae]|uniref:Uncharacterized protein n=2 Tax=Phytophthora TaxID=4783 RepID=A0A6A3ZFY6_9STRA|nr:hypothetical protein PF002_g11777 [Phytophthora fragariae]KAE9311188.1 hypothetical protein PF001_g9850 [Phytophthora fragariae]KAE9325131.1 hypothetical protein PR003_g16567 [Phytophthora rubi]